MTAEEILRIGKWKYPTILQFNIFSKLFQKDISIEIAIEQNDGKVISQYTLMALTDFQNLPNSEIENIENQIWAHCLGCFRSTKYSHDGGITWKESTLEENLKEVGITGRENALKKSKIKNIYIDNEIGTDDRVFSIQIEIEWDKEHGMSLLYFNGKFDDVE